jgi:hypothetical protein
MQRGGQGIRAEVGRYSTLERPTILDDWPGNLVAGSHKLLHRSTPIEPIAAGVPAHGGDTKRVEAAQEGEHRGILDLRSPAGAAADDRHTFGRSNTLFPGLGGDGEGI